MGLATLGKNHGRFQTLMVLAAKLDFPNASDLRLVDSSQQRKSLTVNKGTYARAIQLRAPISKLSLSPLIDVLDNAVLIDSNRPDGQFLQSQSRVMHPGCQKKLRQTRFRLVRLCSVRFEFFRFM